MKVQSIISIFTQTYSKSWARKFTGLHSLPSIEIVSTQLFQSMTVYLFFTFMFCICFQFPNEIKLFIMRFSAAYRGLDWSLK